MSTSANVNWNYSKMISGDENSLVLFIIDQTSEFAVQDAGNSREVLDFVKEMRNNLAIGMSQEFMIFLQSFSELRNYFKV